jgi:hypothetical protein
MSTNTATNTTSVKVTLSDVKTALDTSTYFPPIYAILPTKFRNNMIEDDTCIDDCLDVLKLIIAGMKLSKEERLSKNMDFRIAYNFYRKYTKEAAQCVYDAIIKMESDCYDSDDSDDCDDYDECDECED